MTHRAALLVCLVAAAMLGSGGSAPRQVAFVGDSLTGGWYASTVERSYPNLVAARWHARILSRVRALTTADILSRVGGLAPGAGEVVVEAGTNDLDRTPPAAFAPTYRALIGAIRAREPQAHLVCLGVWWAAGVPGAQGYGPAEYDADIRAGCPGPFVPLSPLFMDARNHGPEGRMTFRGRADLFHPNDRGHAAIASAIASVRQDRGG